MAIASVALSIACFSLYAFAAVTLASLFSLAFSLAFSSDSGEIPSRGVDVPDGPGVDVDEDALGVLVSYVMVTGPCILVVQLLDDV